MEFQKRWCLLHCPTIKVAFCWDNRTQLCVIHYWEKKNSAQSASPKANTSALIYNGLHLNARVTKWNLSYMLPMRLCHFSNSTFRLERYEIMLHTLPAVDPVYIPGTTRTPENYRVLHLEDTILKDGPGNSQNTSEP